MLEEPGWVVLSEGRQRPDLGQGTMMRNRLLILISILTLAGAGFVRADQPPAPAAPPPTPDEAALRQEILSRQFRDFEQSLLRLAQRLERSNKPEDRERAAHLKKAIEVAGTAGVDTKFDRLVNILRSSKALSLQEIQDAMVQNRMLADDIRTILALLLANNRDDELKKEKERIAQLLKRLDEILRQQKILRSNTEAGRMEKAPLSKSQEDLRQNTDKLARDMDKKADGQTGDSKSKSEGKGQGESKGNGQEGKEGKEGKESGKQGQQGEQQESTPGKKHVQDASGHQQQATKKIEENNRQEASKSQDKAIEELEKAKRKLEDILKQLREEELERMLAALQQRCERMLQMQIEVYEGTTRVERAITGNPDHKPTRVNEQRSLQLSDREEDIVKEADKAIQILEAEGSAVAFPEVFIQVREDMKHVARRLGKADVGSVTQSIEQDIIATLKDMIDALKKAQQRMQASKSGAAPPMDSKLIDLLAELKMIRAMQIRVNGRTRIYAEKYTGEQAAAPDIQKELMDLSQRQLKIFEVTNNIYRGNNK